MIGPVTRIGDAFHVGRLLAWLVAIGAVAAVTVIAAVATRLGVLPIALAVILGLIATVASFRWPLVTLLLFAAFIPIEEVLLIDGIGTISRIAAILFAVTYGVPRLGQLTLGAMPRAAWLYVAWATLSLGWAISPNAAIAEIPTLLQLFLVAVLIADFVVRRPEIVRPILLVYSLSASLTAVIGIDSYVNGADAYARAVALNRQDPAQFAAILIPAFVFGMFEALNGPRRFVGSGIALVTLLGILVSGTRGAWLAVIVVVALFILPQLPGRVRIAAVISVVVLFGLAYQVPGIPELISERTGNALSTGGAGRTDIWKVGFSIFESSPIVGVGFANFPIAYTPERVLAADIVSAYRAAGYGPHNILVGTLAELGPIGLVLLAAFIGPLILRRGWGRDAARIQGALAGLMVSALFLDILSNRKQVWLIIGIAAGLAYLARGTEQPAFWRPKWLTRLLGSGSHGSPAPEGVAAARAPAEPGVSTAPGAAVTAPTPIAMAPPARPGTSGATVRPGLARGDPDASGGRVPEGPRVTRPRGAPSPGEP